MKDHTHRRGIAVHHRFCRRSKSDFVSPFPEVTREIGAVNDVGQASDIDSAKYIALACDIDLRNDHARAQRRWTETSQQVAELSRLPFPRWEFSWARTPTRDDGVGEAGIASNHPLPPPPGNYRRPPDVRKSGKAHTMTAGAPHELFWTTSPEIVRLLLGRLAAVGPAAGRRKRVERRYPYRSGLRSRSTRDLECHAQVAGEGSMVARFDRQHSPPPPPPPRCGFRLT